MGEVGEVGTEVMVWEGVGGCERVWEGVGGCGRMWERVGGCGRMWEGVEGSGREWKGVGRMYDYDEQTQCARKMVHHRGVSLNKQHAQTT